LPLVYDKHKQQLPTIAYRLKHCPEVLFLSSNRHPLLGAFVLHPCQPMAVIVIQLMGHGLAVHIFGAVQTGAVSIEPSTPAHK
jgi:hypothetical protein